MQMLNKMLKDAVTIAIGGHIRPDGDCVGSCIGLYQYIKDNYKDKKADVYLEEIPDSFHFLKPADVIRHEIPADVTYDLFICLDCGDKGRLGFSAPLFDRAKRTFCIDHHISNKGFASDSYVVPDASSTCELVYQLLDEEKISPQTAEALYLGIVHDTGVFQYSCAEPSTFRMAAKLLEKGIDGPRIIQETFYEKTYAQNQILGRALLESILFMDKKCIATYITKKTMDFYGVVPKDLEGIVSQLRLTLNIRFIYHFSVFNKRSAAYFNVFSVLGGIGLLIALSLYKPEERQAGASQLCLKRHKQFQRRGQRHYSVFLRILEHKFKLLCRNSTLGKFYLHIFAGLAFGYGYQHIGVTLEIALCKIHYLIYRMLCRILAYYNKLGNAKHKLSAAAKGSVLQSAVDIFPFSFGGEYIGL